MEEYDREIPGYGFASNKGYGSEQHIEALQKIRAVADTQKNLSDTFL